MVEPRPITLGVFIRALMTLGADEGDMWRDYDPATCLALLDVLCESVTVEPDDIQSAAKQQWDRMMREYLRSIQLAKVVRKKCEAAVLEKAAPNEKSQPFKLVRSFSVLQPTEREAAMKEPLYMSLCFAEAARVQMAFDKTKE